jgi:hypothetical protein
MQTNTFLVNYSGHPFMQSLTENVSLFKALMAMHFVTFCAASEVFLPLNDMLELAPLPVGEVGYFDQRVFLASVPSWALSSLSAISCCDSALVWSALRLLANSYSGCVYVLVSIMQVHGMEFQTFLLALMAGNTAAVWVYETVVVQVFRAIGCSR